MVISAELQKYIDSVEKNENNVSETAKQLVVLCADAFVLGGSWGLLPNEEVGELFKTKPTDEEQKFIRCKKVSNGYIVEVNRDYLKWIINAFVENAIGDKYDIIANERKEEENKKFDRFLNRVLEGKECHILEGNTHNVACIGLYSVNEVQLVQVNGIEYPAYRLTIDEFLERLYLKAKEKGSVVGVKVCDSDGNLKYVSLTSLYNSEGVKNAAFVQSVTKGLTIGETKRSVFIEISIKLDLCFRSR